MPETRAYSDRINQFFGVGGATRRGTADAAGAEAPTHEAVLHVPHTATPAHTTAGLFTQADWEYLRNIAQNPNRVRSEPTRTSWDVLGHDTDQPCSSCGGGLSVCSCCAAARFERMCIARYVPSSCPRTQYSVSVKKSTTRIGGYGAVYIGGT